jgi:hypothetical protein
MRLNFPTSCSDRAWVNRKIGEVHRYYEIPFRHDKSGTTSELPAILPKSGPGYSFGRPGPASTCTGFRAEAASTFGTILAVSAEDKFKAVREKAAQGQLVIFRPDGKYLLLPALRKDTVSPEMVAAVERMIPSKTRRNVAAISDTTWAEGDKPSLQSANQAIPFFGLLMGFTSIGHSVWIFDGAADIFEPGCREADVLIVDSARLPTLSTDCQGHAAKVMRNPQIFVHDRTSYQLRKK